MPTQAQAQIDALKAQAVAAALAAPSMKGQDLAQVVTTQQPYVWTQTEWKLAREDGTPGYGEQTAPRFHVVAYDFGVKLNILRMLASRGCKVTVVPAKTPAAEVLKHNPDGIFLSNGPGDPQPCDYAIAATQELIETGIPLFGICLGHQLLALASGAKTLKMKFGRTLGQHLLLINGSESVNFTQYNSTLKLTSFRLVSNSPCIVPKN